ncbi:hypothetical protein GS597_11265 [Synechococcales cyanobacterium C]|uniref:Sulfotransferase domain-containing protein n=1 Tax=Petrachloros mirabilis ULC683 TaxID=2781853 RepID=A0A8K2A011_9CYAN|nr:sulfotransferase domain-containing protein [Petrachloros mirabilis]NCJ07076.1 hypothetical protein [Petrachloros mirabilis ULC683]
MEVPIKLRRIASKILYRSKTLRKIYVKTRFSEEIKFSYNTSNSIALKSKKSILFFTTHKCASMYVGKTLKKILKPNKDMIFIDLNAYRSAKGSIVSSLESMFVGAPENIDDPYLLERVYFEPSGYFFGPLRHIGYLDLVKNIDDYKIMLMLRDPRNMLVSLYSTIRYNHILPFASVKDRKRMIEDRKKVSSQTIDEFVLDQKDFWLNRYQLYCNKLLGKENVLFLRFEDMVNQKESWLSSIIYFLDVHPDEKMTSKIIREYKTEQVNISNYKRKLRSETIDILNHDFHDILNLLNYEL